MEAKLSGWLERIKNELDEVMEFWLKYSHDKQYGGFFTCLTADGKVYDDTKYCWLQSRQVWMYARLYNEVERFKKPSLLQHAVDGAEFLIKHCLIEQNGFKRCPFSVSRQGNPIKVQRQIFSECFFVMAMSEVWRATHEPKYKELAVAMMNQISVWCMFDETGLEKQKFGGNPEASSLAVHMMALCLSEQMRTCRLPWQQESLERWAVDRMMMHVKNGRVLENVSADGKEMNGSNGRLQIPGHAIECGWFLLQYSERNEDKAIAQTAIDVFINASFEQGWDAEHGGLFYFVDSEALPTMQLEWAMKLWWPHTEAMVAFLAAYRHTSDTSLVERFELTAGYAFDEFKSEGGEWFGYLSRRNGVSVQAKGGQWKGCFHLPRSLYLCQLILQQLIEKSTKN